MTCDDFAELTRDDQQLVEALRRRGLEARPVVWDDPGVEWAAIPTVVIRSTWDYLHRRDTFVEWAAQVEAVTTLCNSAEVVRWNTHKGYLMELEDRGVPVVPTAWMAQGDRIDLEELRASREWGDVVLKPAVSAGAHGTHRVPAGGDEGQVLLDGLLVAGDVLVQPYLQGVEDGELSLMFVDGAYTHAVHKRPGSGDFRVQEHLGGTTQPTQPEDEVIDLAAWVLEASGHEFLYARVDVLAASDGTWQLAELEVVEPSLYLVHDDHAADTLADAIAARR